MKLSVIFNFCTHWNIVAYLFLGYLLCGCSNLKKDAPEINVPVETKDFIYQKYPSAEITDMRVLEAGRVYQIDFDFNGVQYQSVATNSRILNTTRRADDQLPAVLLARLDSLAIRGGELSNPRTVESYYTDVLNTEQIFDYKLNGQTYVLSQNSYSITLRPYQYIFYRTKSINDLPEKIQEYINVRDRPNPAFINSLTNLNAQSKQYIINNNELTFVDCRVNVLNGGLKNYEVTVKYLGITNLIMLFDEQGNLISVPQFNRIKQFDQNFDKLNTISNLKFAEIEHFRNLFASQSQLFGFNLDGQQNFNSSYRNEYENVTSYDFVLYNHAREYWSLQYNGRKELVKFYYSSK